MKNATKKQMIDFVNGRMRTSGKSIPKYVLQKCTKEQLMQAINSDAKIKAAFEEYIKEDGTTRNVKKTGGKTIVPSDEKIQELNELVDELVEDPTSFLAIIQFKEFMASLPYGTIDMDTLNATFDKLKDVAPVMAFSVLEYTVDQGLYFQNS